MLPECKYAVRFHFPYPSGYARLTAATAETQLIPRAIARSHGDAARHSMGGGSR